MTVIKNYRMLANALLAPIVVSAAIPACAQFSVMYNFGSVSSDPLEGARPGLVVQGRDGSIYTTSFQGGTNGHGTVFKITPAGQVRVLYSFCSLANCADGSEPWSGLTLRPDGHFLGTTWMGGTSGYGTIFDISETGSLTVLYSFTGGPDGYQPMAPPILGADGSFYGVTRLGGEALKLRHAIQTHR